VISPSVPWNAWYGYGAVDAPTVTGLLGVMLVGGDPGARGALIVRAHGKRRTVQFGPENRPRVVVTSN
jgi:hypothetical protein